MKRKLFFLTMLLSSAQAFGSVSIVQILNSPFMFAFLGFLSIPYYLIGLLLNLSFFLCFMKLKQNEILAPTARIKAISTAAILAALIFMQVFMFNDVIDMKSIHAALGTILFALVFGLILTIMCALIETVLYLRSFPHLHKIRLFIGLGVTNGLAIATYLLSVGFPQKSSQVLPLIFSLMAVFLYIPWMILGSWINARFLTGILPSSNDKESKIRLIKIISGVVSLMVTWSILQFIPVGLAASTYNYILLAAVITQSLLIATPLEALLYTHFFSHVNKKRLSVWVLATNIITITIIVLPLFLMLRPHN